MDALPSCAQNPARPIQSPHADVQAAILDDCSRSGGCFGGSRHCCTEGNDNRSRIGALRIADKKLRAWLKRPPLPPTDMKSFMSWSGFGAAGMLITLTPAASAAETTVVLCVTSTNPSWGQSPDQITTWHTNMYVKDAPGYAVYDIEVGRSQNSISYLSLYRFTGDVSYSGTEPRTLAEFNAYKTSKLIRKIEISNPGNLLYWEPAISTQVLNALTTFTALIAERQTDTSRFVLCFLGHGAPWAFFEDVIQYRDSLTYMGHVRRSFPAATLIGDFSTNCNNGYFDWISSYAPFCDLLLSSEKEVGGFNLNDITNISHFHLRNYHHFWASTVSTPEAIDRIIANREALWQDGSKDIIAKKVEQSLAVYTSAHLRPLARQLAQNAIFQSRHAAWVASKANTYWMTDLGTFVQEVKDPELTIRFEAFRSRYTSNRSLFTWQNDTFGCSVFDKNQFYSYISSANVAPVARAPATVAAVRGDPVAIDGSASSDANLDPITYRWTQVSGPSVTLRNADRPQVSLTAPSTSSATELELELVVSDGLLPSAPARVKIALAGVPAGVTTPGAELKVAISGASANVTIPQGERTQLSATATGTGTLTYQWFKDGTSIPGATAATYSLTADGSASGGSFTVEVTNSVGKVTSSAASVRVIPTNRLANLSVRTALNSGQTLIVGAVVAEGTKGLLLRAAGPALNQFGLSGLPNPAMDLYTGGSQPAASNDDWNATLAPIFQTAGAFGFVVGSKDSALNPTIGGAFTVQVKGAGAGSVLVEAYDLGAETSPRLVNLSARHWVGTGADVLIAGFVVSGTGTKQVLIRAVGPTLASFGVTGVLADPQLEVLDSSGRLLASNDDWNAALSPAFGRVGAFPLVSGSRDAAALVTLTGGASYTVKVSGYNNTTGEALIEVYEVF